MKIKYNIYEILQYLAHNRHSIKGLLLKPIPGLGVFFYIFIGLISIIELSILMCFALFTYLSHHPTSLQVYIPSTLINVIY